MKYERSSGNVFADLGCPNAAALKVLAGECAKLQNGAAIFREKAKRLREDVRD